MRLGVPVVKLNEASERRADKENLVLFSAVDTRRRAFPIEGKPWLTADVGTATPGTGAEIVRTGRRRTMSSSSPDQHLANSTMSVVPRTRLATADDKRERDKGTDPLPRPVAPVAGSFSRVRGRLV